jgi:hypothetical protein
VLEIWNVPPDVANILIEKRDQIISSQNKINDYDLAILFLLIMERLQCQYFVVKLIERIAY